MALIVEVRQISDGLWAVTTQQLVESEDNPDFEVLQCIVDESADEAFRLIEVRDLIRVLLQRTPLEPREREVISLFLEGWDFPDIAKRLGISRQSVQQAFHRAVARFRQTAKALGIAP